VDATIGYFPTGRLRLDKIRSGQPRTPDMVAFRPVVVELCLLIS
jgi:hypothetical protein